MSYNDIITRSEPCVSLIIPVYNAEKYIKHNIDSILAQTFTDFEVIYVTDGCTDSSLEIIQSYDDDRIKLIENNDNMGAAIRRNQGVLASRGEYLIFVDCDDYLKIQMLERLYDSAKSNDADVAICGYDSFDGKLRDEQSHIFDKIKKRISTWPIVYSDNEDDLSFMMANAPWNKLVKKELIINEGICFQDLRNCNDIFYSVSVVLAAKRIVIVDEQLYLYREDADNNISNDRVNKRNYLLEALQELYNRFLYRGYNLVQFRNLAYQNILSYRGMTVYKDIISEYESRYKDLWHIDLEDAALYVYENVENFEGKRVIIYGAGQVGYDVKRQLENVADVVAVSDKNINIPDTINPQDIVDYEFDYLIIAVRYKNIADEIMLNLMSLGVAADKIVWDYPEVIRVK